MIRKIIKSVIKAPIESIISVDGEKIPQFISTWETENLGGTASITKTIVLPMTAGPLVDWGDGTIDNLNTHVYAVAGTKEIIIDNTNSDFRFNDTGDKIKITDVSQCNGLNVTNSGVFNRCVNMTWTATDIPNITATNLQSMFLGAEVFDGDMTGWDLSACTSFSNMFFGAFALTGIGMPGWDVSSCTNMNQMFFACNSFNAAIESWTTTALTNMGGIFRVATIFNRPIGSWDVSKVTTANHVFAGSTSFAQSVDAWDVSSMQTMHAMFGLDYNIPIPSWVTTDLVNPSFMFQGNNTWNQSVDHFNMAKVTNLDSMFNSCDAYDQDMSSWLIPLANDLDNFLSNSGYSQTNYDLWLVALDAQTLQSSVNMDAVGVTFTAAPAAGGVARASLISNDLWTITDGGPL